MYWDVVKVRYCWGNFYNIKCLKILLLMRIVFFKDDLDNMYYFVCYLYYEILRLELRKFIRKLFYISSRRERVRKKRGTVRRKII